MLIDQDWEALFPPRILMRGYRYFEDGHITRLKPVDGGWLSRVEGAQSYDVFVSDDILESTCDCPYFYENGLCKHIAAACYGIEDHDQMMAIIGENSMSEPQGKRSTKDAPAQTKISAENVLKELNSEKQLEFLLEIVRTDKHWEDVAIHRFGDLEASHVKAEFISGAKDIVRQNSYRGFVDFRNAYRCEMALREYIDDFFSPFMKRSAYDLVLQLTFAFELMLPKIAIDDSDGFFTSMIDLVNGYWDTLLASGDASLAQDLFEWLSELVLLDEEIEDEAEILRYLQDNACDVIKEYFATDLRFAKRTEELAESQLESMPDFKTDHAFVYSFERVRWAIIKLRCMLTLGSPLSDLEAFANEQPASYDVTRILVDCACREEDNDKAIRLLRSYINRTESVYPTEAALDLLKLLESNNKNNEAAELYLDLIVKGRPQNEKQLRKWIRKAKMLSDKNWQEKKTALIKRLSGNYHRLAEIFDAEGDLSDLMETMQEKGTLSDLDRYEKSLVRVFPAEFLSRYETLVRRRVFGSAANRDVYQDHVQLLARMQHIPGGFEAATQIVKELREAYPRRRALMEELNRLF